jgi:hypothetical protein
MFERPTAPGVETGEGLGVVVEQSARDVADARSDGAIADRRDVSRRSGRRPTFLRHRRQPSRAPQARGGFRNSRRNQGFTIVGVLRRLWIPLIILVVFGAGGLTVSRLHGIFGSDKRPSYADTKINDTKPFNPKHLTFEVFGPPGAVADISYFDANSDPQHVVGARLPWSLKFAITDASAMGSIAAQGDSASIGCRITVDGEVKAEKITHEVSAFTFCLLKAA